MHPIAFLTPCSRPENLPKLHESIVRTVGDLNWLWVIAKDFRFTHPIFEPSSRVMFIEGIEPAKPSWSSHKGIEAYCHYGKPLLNAGLDELASLGWDGMVGFLDDDTVLHPNLRKAFEEFSRHPSMNGFTVQQQDTRGRLRIDPTQNCGRIDSGCIFMHTDLIGKTRHFAEPGADAVRYYEADQQFFRDLYCGRECEWIHLPMVASIYNALR